MRRAIQPLHRTALAVALGLAPACGDAVATTATDSSTSSTSSGPTATTDVAPTTSITGATSATDTSGGLTGSSGEPTTTLTTTTTTGVSATDSTSTTDPGTSTSTSTDTTDTTGTTDTTTDTGDPPKSCLDVDFPVQAALCGDNGPTCVTQRDELVSADPAFRNDMPAIALRGDCGPAVLYSVAEGGFFGFYAERTGADAWLVEQTPMNLATGSLEFDPAADTSIAVVDDGAFGVTLWQRTAGNWAQESALAGQNHTRAPQLVRDAQGSLHLGHIDSDNLAYHTLYDGAWSKDQVLTSADIHVRIALDAAIAPHMTTWTSKDATWKLQYMTTPGVSEVITPLGSNVLDRAHHSLALLGPDATPWVMLARKQGDGTHHDIILAHRTGANTWALETLAAENPGTDKLCDFSPNGPGELCMYDYVRLHPLVLLASATELRALYLAIRYQGTLTSECLPDPFPMCFWEADSESTTSELRVAWPGSQPDEHQIAAFDVLTDRATGRLDTAGDMHLSFYDYPPPGTDSVVRYLRIGP